MSFKVYTKTGDKGSTGLIGGTRVPKDHIRIDAYGTVDELNSVLGVVTDSLGSVAINAWILEIQDRLFTVGSTLATDPHKDTKMKLPDLHESDIEWLEQRIDEMDEVLPPMKSFIPFPAGTLQQAMRMLPDAFAEGAERICVHMQNNEEFVPEVVLKYLNRLSDFLFVLSRYIVFQNKGQEIPWRARI